MRLLDSANVVTHSFGGAQDNFIRFGKLGLGTTTPGSMLTVRGDIALTNSDTGAGIVAISSTPPTVIGGNFGTAASVTGANGTAAFTVFVGTGGAASTGSLSFPAATTGWVVNCQDVTS